MQQKTWDGMIPAVLIAFLAVGIPYWLTPYNTPDLMDRVYGPALLALVVLGVLVRVQGSRSFWRSALPVGAALPAAVFVRVVLDGFRDPTSHNLWPFEVVFALVVGTGCAAIGVGVGGLLVKLRGGDHNDNDGDRP